MTTKIRLHETPVRTYARAVQIGDIPPPSYESARDTVHQIARTRAGMVCGVVVAALLQFAPDAGSRWGAHGVLAALLAIAPAVVIAAAAFPLIAWKARRDEARLKIQYGIRSKP